MKTQIQSIHFDADKKLLQFIEEKLDKLDKVYSRIENGLVTLKIDKDSKKKDKVVEIYLKVPKNNLFVKTKSENFENAISDACDQLKVQLIKQTKKLNYESSINL